jgi:hypothetical protein
MCPFVPHAAVAREHAGTADAWRVGLSHSDFAVTHTNASCWSRYSGPRRNEITITPAKRSRYDWLYAPPSLAIISAHFKQPLAQSSDKPRPGGTGKPARVSVRPNEAQALPSMVARALARSKLWVISQTRCDTRALSNHRQTQTRRPSRRLLNSRPISRHPTARKVSR